METAESNHGLSAASVAAPRRSGPSAWAAITLSTLAGFGPPLAPVAGGLDAGWQLGLSWARELGLHWGSDLIFTYGPWGHVVAAIPLSSSLVWSSVVAQFVALSLVAWASWRLTEARGLWWSALLALPVTAAAASSGVATALFLGIVLGCFVLVFDARLTSRVVWFVGGLAGFSVLIKFNTGTAAIAIGAFAMLATVRWRFALAGFIASSLAGFVGGWLAAGQTLRDLVPWLKGSVELAAAYPTAMRHVRDDLAGWLPLATLAFGLGMTALLGGVSWMRGAELPARRRVALALAVAGAAFALYLASATRLDAGHLGLLPIGLFILGVPIAGSLGRPGASPGRPSSRVPIALVAAITVVCVSVSVAILGREGAAQYFHPVRSLGTLEGELRLAVSENARSAALEADRGAIRDAYPVPSWELTTLNPTAASLTGPLPAVVAALRGGSVHVEPWAISLAWAHGLDWSPMPVMQSYAAYTSRLDELNAAALTRPEGPAGILRQSAAIDDKYPLWESPRYQLAMLCNFRQASTDGRWQALVRATGRCERPRIIATATLGHGVQIPVPKLGGALIVAELSPRHGSSSATRKPALVFCGPRAYRLSQGVPSGPLVLRAEASGWDKRVMPAPCETLSADRSVEVTFSSVKVREE
ncbi:MAG: hypothetical protein WC538_11980 [Thermoanaerobaculia bacterium]|jgi:hypothetical protein